MELIREHLNDADVDTLAVAVQDRDSLSSLLNDTDLAALDTETMTRYAEERMFSEHGSIVLEWPLPETFRARVLLLVRCSPDSAADDVRAKFGSAGRKSRTIGAGRLGIVAAQLDDAMLGHAVEGASLGGWYFHRRLGALRQEQVAPTVSISVVAPDGLSDRAASAVQRASVIGSAVGAARDRVSEPANVLDPQTFAEQAEQIAADAGLEITVHQPDELQRMGAGAILGVGKGSSVDPCLIHLVYRPDGPTVGEPIALVGKCITFDTGGYSIKSGEGMVNMKSDMAGGAAVLAAMSALSELGCQRDVHGVICAAENMISGSAFRPGDVLTAMNGITIEVISTDAEGRLVLADGLVFAARQGVSEMIDLATLTGAANVALGGATALFASEDGLADRLLDAAESAGERTWRMPIYDDFGRRLVGDVADLKNSGGRSGSAIVAARFLQYFTEGVPWAHLDIAGSGRSTETRGYTVKGATGAGVRTLLGYVAP